MKTSYLASRKITRRLLLKVFAASGIAAAFGYLSTALLTRYSASSPRKYRFFSDKEAEILIAMCERIIPRDDTAGATDLGVINYIDRNLMGHFAKHKQTYRKGLPALDNTALSLRNTSFCQLSAVQQDELLRILESGDVPESIWTHVGSQKFFKLAIAHTMQGFYGPPRHGGNRGFQSYKILDLDYPQIIGQNRYPEI